MLLYLPEDTLCLLYCNYFLKIFINTKVIPQYTIFSGFEFLDFSKPHNTLSIKKITDFFKELFIAYLTHVDA